jgi:hypothetical protein
MARPIAQKTYNALMMDSGAMLSNACLCDFFFDGTDNEFTSRFGALQNAVRRGATVDDLDHALGSGMKLTALVKKYGSNVVFPQTLDDEMEE